MSLTPRTRSAAPSMRCLIQPSGTRLLKAAVETLTLVEEVKP